MKPDKQCKVCKKWLNFYAFQFPRCPGLVCQICWVIKKESGKKSNNKRKRKLQGIREAQAVAVQPDEHHKNGKLKKKWKPGKQYDRSGSGGSYYERDLNLKKIGYGSYLEYLKSPLWSTVRARVFGHYGKTCALCPRPAEQIHHNWYGEKELRGQRMCNMMPICKPCHQSIEYKDGRKVALHEARNMFDRIREIHLIEYDKMSKREKKQIRKQTEEEKRYAQEHLAWLREERFYK